MKLNPLFILLMLVFLVACGSDPAQPIAETDPEPEPTAVPAEPPTAVPTAVEAKAVAEEPTAESEIVPEPTIVPTEEIAEEPVEEAVEAEPEADVVIDDNVANIGVGRQFTLPGDSVYPEGVSYDPATGNFYTGATADGTLFVGNVNGADEMAVFSGAGADGRTTAVGTKVDAEGRLWVAGGRTGQVFVYDTADRSLVASFTAPGSGFINDIAITDDGVYFTDSFTPTLWRVTDLAQGEAEAWLDFTGTAINYGDGLNLNGIVATEDGSTLIVVHSDEGELYRIDVASKAVSWIDTGTIPLTFGDGMVLIGNTIYVVRNSWWEIVEIQLSEDYTFGTGGAVTYSELFIYPTTIAFTGNTFLVANSQFNNEGLPSLPFTVSQIPAPLQAVRAETAIVVETDTEAESAAGTTSTFQLEAWGDNWFAAYLGEELIVEDSVSITTERSFNSETAIFEASYPLQLNFILKDFIENDTGLEYIGANNQQMGDGGFIMQLTDLSSGDVVAVSNSDFACTVIHEAPLDNSCENAADPVAGEGACGFISLGEPDGWQSVDFDDSDWTATTVHSAAAVDPKDGYNNIPWDSSAEFVWGPDLETNNTLLCRVTVSGE
ncbi:MAG: hypothetical protein AB8G95_24950 [Anaerolineae bacterium]